MSRYWDLENSKFSLPAAHARRHTNLVLKRGNLENEFKRQQTASGVRRELDAQEFPTWRTTDLKTACNVFVGFL